MISKEECITPTKSYESIVAGDLKAKVLAQTNDHNPENVDEYKRITETFPHAKIVLSKEFGKLFVNSINWLLK